MARQMCTFKLQLYNGKDKSVRLNGKTKVHD